MTAPTPIEKKRALGNPGKRALPDIAETHAISAIGLPPGHIGDAGLEMWNQVTAASPWLGESDRPLIVQFCEMADRKQHLSEQLKQTDDVLLTDKGYAYANPLVGMLSTLQGEMLKMMSLLGLTPADRARLGLAEVKAQSTLEKLRQQKAAR